MDLIVALHSNALTAATVPGTVTIPAGHTSTTFDLSVVDDVRIDGCETAVITASAPGFTSGSETIAVLDDEHRNLIVTIPASAVEGEGLVQGTIAISGTLTADLIVDFASSDVTEVTVPTPMVTIPAGETGAPFSIQIEDDAETDGPQSVTISADAAGFTSGSAVAQILDNDRNAFSVLCVDIDGSPGGNGSTWATAFTGLQEALTEAELLNSDAILENDVNQIWLAEGIYRPTVEFESGDPRSTSFELLDGVTLIGGFSGSEIALSQRDWVTHRTTLSGDIGIVGDSSDNAYTVVYCREGVQSAFDGVSITAGRADGETDSAHRERSVGGAVYSAGTLDIINSSFFGNVSASNGGGVYNSGNMTITNSTLSANSTSAYGGGMFNSGAATVTNCTLSGNSAGTLGSGLYNYGTLHLANSIIALNENDELFGAFSAEGAGNLVGFDPGFVRSPGTNGPDDRGDLRLTPRSAAIDVGSIEHLPLDVFDVDGDGDLDEPLPLDGAGGTRELGASVDVGAFEYDGLPSDGREAPSTRVDTACDSFDLYDGQVSLREAVFYARIVSSEDGITFAPELSGATITLSGYPLSIDLGVTIDVSVLPGGIRIDGGGTSRVLNVIAGDQPVELIGLVVTNGRSLCGGGILNSGILSVANAVFWGNSATGAAFVFGGGAICNYGTLTVTDSTLAGNSANRTGGGILSQPEAVLINTIVARNSAPLGPDLYACGPYSSFSGTHNLIGDGSRQYSLSGQDGNLIGTSESPLDPRFNRDPSDGGDGWGDDPDTPGVDESANDDPGDLRLRPTSPAVNAGDNALLPPDADDWDDDGDTEESIPFDAGGNARIENGIVDIGAYETLVSLGNPIMYVDADSAPNGDGLSWNSAFNDLGDALAIAAVLNSDGDSTDIIEQIWIAEGIYLPTRQLDWGDPSCASFSLVSGVELLGGFTGVESIVTERDWTAHETILSGDVGAAERSNDNAYTVVFCGENVEATIDGFSITAGHASGAFDTNRREQRNGAGVYNAGTLSIAHCAISDNLARDDGGGIFNQGILTVRETEISDNSAEYDGGGIRNAGTLTLTNSRVWTNRADKGGGVHNSGEMIVAGSSLFGNVVEGDGGGVFSSGVFIMTNGVLCGNSADEEGGGVHNDSGELTMVNCTLSANSADNGGGLVTTGSESSAIVNNTIVAGNIAVRSASDIYCYQYPLSGAYSIVGDGTGQTAIVHGELGNQVGTEASPIDPLLSDWTQGETGRWGFCLLPGSPAIDAGWNALAVSPTGPPLPEDIFENPRIVGDVVDVGAAEGSSIGVPACTYVVTSLEKGLAADGELTFFEALEAANRNQPVGDAPAGSYNAIDVIRFADGLSGTILVDEGELPVMGDLRIMGPGAELLVFEANGESRVCGIYGTAFVDIEGATIANGYEEFGGGIRNFGTLVLTGTVLSGNTAFYRGGGIDNSFGTVVLKESTLLRNSAGTDGGGVYNRGTTTVTKCEFEGNQAASGGGGIYNSIGPLEIDTSRFIGQLGPWRWWRYSQYRFGVDPQLDLLCEFRESRRRGMS